MHPFFKLWAAALVAVVCVGCAFSPPPDPNDPKEVGIMQPEVLQRNLKWASDFINDRVAKQEITDADGKQLLSEYANKLTNSIEIARVDPTNAWRYGDVFRTAKRYDLAEQVYRISVESAKKSKNEDRRINDSLRLAEALFVEGRFDEAFSIVRSTFDSIPQDKAPILMAVLYEIVPVAEKNGKDLELAKLLEEAIDQHNQVIVDPELEAGKAFLAVKMHHIGVAWRKVRDLYRQAGREDLAQKSIEQSANMQNRTGQF